MFLFLLSLGCKRKWGDMEVKVIAATPNPIKTCGYAAGLCYGKDVDSETYEKTLKRVKHCVKVQHLGILEHATITWRVDGLTRACANQLVRHRIASYNQQSQRYCKLDLSGGVGEWFTVPDKVKDKPELVSEWSKVLRDMANVYTKSLEAGVPAEDARAILPQNGHTNIIITMNLRTFEHFMELRLAPGAQKEIQTLAREMLSTMEDIDSEYFEMGDILRNNRAVKQQKDDLYADLKMKRKVHLTQDVE